MAGSAECACIGVDIGGTNLRFGLVDGHGAIIDSERSLTEIHLGRDTFLEHLFRGIALLRQRGEALGMDVRAVGLGIPGLIAASGRIHSSVNLEPIEGINLRTVVAEAAGLPVVAVNDANAAAYGEKKYGAGRPHGSLLLFTLGTGVGSGLILDGNLWTGADGVAAEYGHATVEPDGTLCSCGNRGCLEQYASARSLVAAAVHALDGGAGGALTALPRASITAEDIAVSARQGDPVSRSLFETAGRYLGIAGATIVNLLNLEAIVLVGGVAASFDLLAEPIRREIHARAFAVPAERVRIVKGELGDDAGILGAAALAREKSGL
ncbi:MAG TPA: ROK family protein [Geobacteraceae bacterium]|nr:ROK family protein [Geobacteraceae bacterium]